jgi:hypothetical protein
LSEFPHIVESRASGYSLGGAHTIILHKPITEIKNEKKGNKKYWEAGIL